MMSAQHWTGGAWLLPGFAVFQGAAAANMSHAHCAHCLFPADVLRIYVDPLTVEGRALFHAGAHTEQLLPASRCERLLGSFHQEETMRQALLVVLGLPLLPPIDGLASVISALETSITASADVDRTSVAAITDLSPSRFSHWFVDQTGLPLRRYRKWLRLVVSLNHVAQCANLTEAAYAADFADSAHLSRTFRHAFGINPLAALQIITLPGSARIFEVHDVYDAAHVHTMR